VCCCLLIILESFSSDVLHCHGFLGRVCFEGEEGEWGGVSHTFSRFVFACLFLRGGVWRMIEVSC
jgi:hypothetical protein